MASILHVDDSKTIRMMVKSILSGTGHSLSEAADGIEGLEVARSQEFDIILTDINMPRMNGLELVSRLRALSRYRFTPILLMTTENSPEMKQEGKRRKATGWITKPFDGEKLKETIAKLVGVPS